MSPVRPDLSLFDRFIIFVVLFFLFSEVISGVSRYYLFQLGYIPLVYVPKILVLLTLISAVFSAILRERISTVYFGTLILLFLSVAVGLYYAQSVLQVAFGVWVLLPLFFGIVSFPTFQRTWSKLQPYIALLWLLAASGMLLNAYYPLPWAGTKYELGELMIEGSRKWSTFGIFRLAGFSRASFAAATQILLLSLFLVVTGKVQWMRALVWLLSGVAIFLTTTKTTASIYIVLTLFLILRRLLPRVLWRPLPALTALIGIVLPFSTLIVSYHFVSGSMISNFLFASFRDRLVRTWPDTLSLLSNHGNAMLGRGIGGIGMAQQYFEPILYNSGDNLYIYLYALMGVCMFFVITAYAIWAGSLDPRGRGIERFFFMVALAVLLEGWTSNLIESPFLAFFFGLSLRYLAARNWRSGVRFPLSHPSFLRPLSVSQMPHY